MVVLNWSYWHKRKVPNIHISINHLEFFFCLLSGSVSQIGLICYKRSNNNQRNSYVFPSLNNFRRTSNSRFPLHFLFCLKNHDIGSNGFPFCLSHFKQVIKILREMQLSGWIPSCLKYKLFSFYFMSSVAHSTGYINLFKFFLKPFCCMCKETGQQNTYSFD